jgi:ElaB/YqjD/DUF883 family membrane-anchored ribosome-binding protein
MDQTRAREIARDAAEQAGKTANEAAQCVGEQLQPALDQGKSVVQDLAHRASEAGRQAMDQAGEFIEGVKWRAISTTRVLGLESTSVSMPRKNPSPRCWLPA